MAKISYISATVGKPKPIFSLHRLSQNLSLWYFLFISLLIILLFISPTKISPKISPEISLSVSGPVWENQIRVSSKPKSPTGFSVLVTGAAGFVGAHAALALKRRGDGVLGLDNFNPYYETTLKYYRRNILEKGGVVVVHGDINDVVLLNKLFDLVAFTHVLHLAAQAGVRHALKDPGSYVGSNVAGFVALLEASRMANPQPAIVFASSSSVYGLNSKVPFSEKDRTDRPASLYAATKKAGEVIAHTYNHIHGLSVTGLRFFTVYGPWGRPDMAYFFFTRDILKGKTISIYEGPDGGTVARDFTYVDDIVKGCLGALDTAKQSTGSGGKKRGAAQFRVFNLGNTKPVSVSELVRLLEKILKVKAKKRILAMPRNGDVVYTHANISMARTEIGYKPSVDLETGLKKFVKWYLSYYDTKKNKKFGW